MGMQSEDDLRRAARVETADDGQRIILNFPTLEEAAQLLSQWRDRSSRATAVSKLHHALAKAGLNLEIRVNGRSVVELGAESMRGAMLSLLGLARGAGMMTASPVTGSPVAVSEGVAEGR